MEEPTHLPSRGCPPRISRRRVFVLVLLMLLASGLFFLWYRRPQPPSSPSIALEEMEPQVAEAIKIAMKRVRDHPRSAESWGFLGEILLAHSCEKPAEECFAHAAQLDERQPRWPYFRYHALRGRDRKAALPYLERAVTLFDAYQPEATAPRLMLVEALLDGGQLEEADAQLRRVEDRAPDNPRVLFNRGVLAVQRNDPARGIDCFQRVADLGVSRKKACAHLAQLYHSLNDHERAAEYNDQARRLPRDDTWPDPFLEECFNLNMDPQRRMHQAQNLEKHGRFREAAVLLQEVARDSKRIAAELSIATNLAQQERFEEAVELLRKLTAREPKMVQMHYNLGAVLCLWSEDIHEKKSDEREQALAKYREAEPALRQAIVLKPDYALAHTFLGLSLWRQGKQREGLTELREGVRLQPVEMLSHYHLARILMEQGQYAEALQQFQQAQRYADNGDKRLGREIEQVRAKMKNSGGEKPGAPERP